MFKRENRKIITRVFGVISVLVIVSMILAYSFSFNSRSIPQQSVQDPNAINIPAEYLTGATEDGIENEATDDTNGFIEENSSEILN
jgi:hypothetical protein